MYCSGFTLLHIFVKDVVMVIHFTCCISLYGSATTLLCPLCIYICSRVTSLGYLIKKQLRPFCRFYFVTACIFLFLCELTALSCVLFVLLILQLPVLHIHWGVKFGGICHPCLFSTSHCCITKSSNSSKEPEKAQPFKLLSRLNINTAQWNRYQLRFTVSSQWQTEWEPRFQEWLFFILVFVTEFPGWLLLRQSKVHKSMQHPFSSPERSIFLNIRAVLQ